jgi:hypothetical protein
MINAYDKGNQKNSLLKVVKLRKVSRVGFGFCSLLWVGQHFISSQILVCNSIKRNGKQGNLVRNINHKLPQEGRDLL